MTFHFFLQFRAFGRFVFVFSKIKQIIFFYSFSGPLPTIMETFKNNNKDVDHMETLEMEALRLSSAANSTEEEEDQPVDFSQNSVGNVMRTSILSKF